MVNAIPVNSVLHIISINKWSGSQTVNNCLSSLWGVPGIVPGLGGHKSVSGKRGIDTK